MTDPASRLHPEPLWTGALEYRLPGELIAQRPSERREDARLMIVDRADASIRHAKLADLPDLVGAGVNVVYVGRMEPAVVQGLADNVQEFPVVGSGGGR